MATTPRFTLSEAGNSGRLRSARRLSISSQPPRVELILPHMSPLGSFLDSLAWDEEDSQTFTSMLSADPVAKITPDSAFYHHSPSLRNRTIRELNKVGAHRKSWSSSFSVGSWLRIFSRPIKHHNHTEDFCMLCSCRQAPSLENSLPYIQMVDIDSLV
ncbi:hypothetical protein DSO57_1025948 [Entomophthora muscae]|uniref:Uncharacterized protein n=1 Tax=Entomophthora muscae TaxID=34485 RepID=A0ACC2T2A7_9FUNG|nr:hypothetical protein DSO57_1025948 [Entomophthora muscae]